MNALAYVTTATIGERVGLPAGQMGNSEVGHMTMGAGRVIATASTPYKRDLALELGADEAVDVNADDLAGADAA